MPLLRGPSSTGGGTVDFRKRIALGRISSLVFTAFAWVGLGASESRAQTGGATPVVSVATNECLDVANASVASGIDVNQYHCHGGTNQQWTAHPANTPG